MQISEIETQRLTSMSRSLVSFCFFGSFGNYCVHSYPSLGSGKSVN